MRLSLTLHVPARSLRCLVINKVLFCSVLNVSLLGMTIFHRHVGKGIMAFDLKLFLIAVSLKCKSINQPVAMRFLICLKRQSANGEMKFQSYYSPAQLCPITETIRAYLDFLVNTRNM